MKVLLIIIILFSATVSATSIFENVPNKRLYLPITGQYLDLTTLSGGDVELQKIQRRFEHNYLAAAIAGNAAMGYLVLSLVGVIKPRFVDDLKMLIPWMATMGAGFYFANCYKDNLKEFEKKYAEVQGQEKLTFGIGYRFNF